MVIMSKFYTYPCGCKYKVIKELPGYELPLLDITYENINRDCHKSYELLKQGISLGVFQLESGLGQTYCKKLKPENIEHLTALGSILRPGCLQARCENNISLTDHYCKRKNNEESRACEFPALEEILKDTYGLIIYQESPIRIGQEICGFSPSKADIDLRKNIGKKLADKLFAVEKDFVEGAIKLGKIGGDDAKKIFGWIKAGARYSFNKCVTLDTFVETKSGFKTIEELCIGEEIKCPDENNDYKYVEVLDKIDSGLQDVYEITLESGKQIKCTLEHKFLCEDGEVRELLDILENHHKIVCENE